MKIYDETASLKFSLAGECFFLRHHRTYISFFPNWQKIKINLKKNVVSVNFHVGQYAKIVEELKTDNSTLKRKNTALVQENSDLLQQVN